MSKWIHSSEVKTSESEQAVGLYLKKKKKKKKKKNLK
jgi:hypothetical protein